jgi:hypothetical protein
MFREPVFPGLGTKLFIRAFVIPKAVLWPEESAVPWSRNERKVGVVTL